MTSGMPEWDALGPWAWAPRTRGQGLWPHGLGHHGLRLPRGRPVCLCTTEAAPLYLVSVAAPVGLGSGTYLIDWVPDPVDWVADPVG